MKKHVFNLMQFGCVAVLLSCVALPARAFTFYLFSNYESSFKDFDGATVELPTTRKNWDTLDHLTIEAADLSGYRFLGWYTRKNGWDDDVNPTADSVDAAPFATTREITGAQINSDAVGTSGTNLQKYKTIVAKYIPIYDVKTAVSPAGTGTAGGDGIYEEGKQVRLSSSAEEGYALKGWEKDDRLVSPTNFSFVAAKGCAGTYTAVFTGKVYRVDLRPKLGEGGTTVITATYGQPMPTPIIRPERYGYDFGGYFSLENGEGVQYYSADGTSSRSWDKAGPADLYACWIPQKGNLNLEFNPGVAKICYRLGESSVWVTNTPPDKTISLQVGTVVHAYALPSSGYEIADYNIENQWETVKDKGVPKDGITFSPTAVQATPTYTVTFVDPTEAHETEWQVLNKGAAATAPTWQRTGYELGWDRDFSSVAADMTVTAVWSPIKSVVRFDPNGGSGTMTDQTAVYDEALTLTSNKFVNGSLFFAHWTTSVDKVAYPDGAVVSNLTTVAGATNVFYAVWEKHTFAVRFFGNGGTNTMADQSFDYGSGTGLRPNAFIRDGFSFVGWATDPTNAVAYFDEDDASALTTVDGTVVPLYAKWMANGSAIDSELSKAIGCDSVNLTTNNFGWVIAPGEGKDGGNALRTNVGGFEYKEDNNEDNTHALNVPLVGKGVLTFRCKTVIAAEPVPEDGAPLGPDDASEFYFKTGSGVAEDVMPSTRSDSDWGEYVYRKMSDAAETVSWELVMRNHYHPDDADYGPCGSDDDYALIDFVRWEPAVTNAMTVGVTFRDADGGVFSNATYVAGEAIGTLPVLKNGDGGDCVWTYGGSAVDAGWIVPAAADGAELLPSWGVVPPEHPKPEATDAVTISSAAVADGKFSLSFKSDAKFDYNLLTNANLLIDSWGVMATEKGTGEIVVVDPPVIDGMPQLFYKVETIQKQD